MTALTDALVTEVHNVLAEFGETLTFIRTEGQVYDVNLAQMMGGGQITFTAFGYPWPYTVLERQNTLIQTEDDRLIVERTTLIPQPGDKVTFQGAQYRIITVDKITMSGAKIAYQLQVRL